jgi:hypothetical protein
MLLVFAADVMSGCAYGWLEFRFATNPRGAGSVVVIVVAALVDVVRNSLKGD